MKKSNFSEREFTYRIDSDTIQLKYTGKTVFGLNEVLFSQDDHLLQNKDWEDSGYTLSPFLGTQELSALRDKICCLMKGVVESVTGQSIEDFQLDQYHRYVNDFQHRQVVQTMIKGGLPEMEFPFPIKRLNAVVSDLCRTQVEVKRYFDKPWGMRVSSIRVVRPMSADSNPPHRDAWSVGMRNLINIYIPIAGSNKKSSLSIIPGSHYWRESDVERVMPGKAFVDGISFSVGCAVNSRYGLIMTRPTLQQNEFMVFTPYLIHGGSRNLSLNLTRVSLEMRFQRCSDWSTHFSE